MKGWLILIPVVSITTFFKSAARKTNIKNYLNILIQFLNIHIKNTSINIKHFSINTQHFYINTQHFLVNTKLIYINTQRIYINAQHFLVNTGVFYILTPAIHGNSFTKTSTVACGILPVYARIRYLAEGGCSR